jgi:phage baseplate assembly protein W
VTNRQDDFRGRGWAFPPAFDLASGTVQMVDGDEDIRQSLSILFTTRPGERIMVPDYGCNLQDYLFETVDETTLTHIRTIISEAILYFEPRIILEDISFDISTIGEGILTISLGYIVEETNSRSNLVFPYYLSEGTLARLT